MRRQLNLLVLAVTLLVIVAFVGPLVFLVRQQADQRARVNAERDAQQVSASLVRLVTASEADPAVVAAAIPGLPDSVSIVVDGEVVAGQEGTLDELADLAASEGRAQSTYTDRGWELAIPVLTSGATLVVYSVVPTDTLTSGVDRAWILLGVLSLGLVIASLIVADGLGRAVVQPSRRIARGALQLGSGDIDTRVEEEGPPELRDVAASFNVLAGRIRDLLAAEREAVADLSHGLRTPLTALRLEVESLHDQDERSAVQGHLDRLEAAVDEMIREARLQTGSDEEMCDIGDVVRSRIQFWTLVAESQDRHVNFTISQEPMLVGLRSSEAAAVVDALIDNVFTHTTPRTSLRLVLRTVGDGVLLEVADSGPGFPDRERSIDRGVSAGGSTGLGLDIVRRLAERTGGGVRIARSPEGGALVEVKLGVEGSPSST